MEMYFYPASIYVNKESGYTCRYNYSGTENFQLHYHDYYELFLMISGEGIHYGFFLSQSTHLSIEICRLCADTFKPLPVYCWSF